jgi:hypothetical protein
MTLLRDLALLTRVGLRAEVGRLRVWSRGQRAGLALALAVVGALMLLVATALAGVEIEAEAARAALVGAYLAAGVVLTAAALPLGVAFLDEGSDAPFLLATPAHPAAVIAARLAATTFWDSLLALAILAPLTVGLGVALDAGPLFYVAGLILLPLVPLAPLAAGHALAFLLLRAVPPRAVQTALGIAGALLGSAWYFARAGSASAFGTQLAGGLVTLGGTLAWLPLGWPGRALAALSAGDLGGAVVMTAGTALVAVGAFVLAAGLGAAVARRGWYELAPRSSGRRRRGRRVSFGAGPVGAVLLKDWRITYRDPNVWTRLLGPLAFFGIIVWQALANAAALSGPAGVPVKGLAVVGATVFLAWSLNNRLAVTAFNRDRHAVVWTLASPAPIRRVLWAKLLVAIVPQLALVWPLAALLVWIVGLPPLEAAVQILATPALIVLLAALSVVVATRFPKFDWRDARRVTPVAATLWATLAHLLALGGAVAALVALPGRGLAGAALGVLAIALAAVGALAWVLGDGAERVARWELGG